MRSQIPHKLPPKYTFSLRLPGDILYLVANFSSHETRANLVQCNKWLHEACTPLLFKEIYLHAPTQLIKLCDNESAIRMLNRTDSIYLGERLFYPSSWPSPVIENAPELLIRVLCATSSFTRLQILSSDRVLVPNYEFYGAIQGRLDSAASDPGFLPDLTIAIEFPYVLSLHTLCHNRPIIYHFHSNGIYMKADVYLDSEAGESAPDPKHLLSAHDIGVLVRESRWNSPNIGFCYTPGISIHVWFPQEIKRGDQDPWSWVQTMLLATESHLHELHTLDVSFEPNPPYQCAAVQFAAVEELYKEFPELEEVAVSYPKFNWSRSADCPNHKSDFFPEDPLPDWTPKPLEANMSHWMDWWLDALDLDSPEAQAPEELSRTTTKLLDGILFRWDSYYNHLPSPEAILEYLSNRRV